MNYDGKTFKPIQSTNNGETSEATIFKYHQNGNLLTAEYSGGNILFGHLIGLVDIKGRIEMRYHQVNNDGNLMTGICFSTPEHIENGKIRLHEKWQWTSGDRSKGVSILEEV